MRPSRGSIAPFAWLRRPTRTARMRLTLLYAGLFLLLGTGLLAVTFLLTTASSSIHVHAQPVVRLVLRHGSAAVKVPAPLALLPGPRVSSQVANGVVAQHNADLGQLLKVSWIVLAVTTLGAAVLGWFAAGRVLRPLRAMATTARTISAGNLHERLAITGPDDEFKQLGDTLDELLQRLQGSFEAQRRFVANASHELRTPLTLERTLTQVALADPGATAETLRATCEELLVSQAEHERLLEALLTLASSERGVDRSEPVDLAALAEHELARLDPEIRRRGLVLQTRLEAAPTAGDAALIQRLVANLIDNSVAHNLANGKLEIRTATEDGHALISVVNAGAQIPPDQTERLFEPFARLDPGRAGGDGHHGLGLSIVRAIATAHHAPITLEARPDGGLDVSVSFPALGTVLPVEPGGEA